MPVTVSTQKQRHIGASPQAVWSVVADPACHDRLDPRTRLRSTAGDGGVGTEIVYVVRGSVLRTRLTYLVVESDPCTAWTAEVTSRGRRVGVQHAELRPDGDGTLLSWTVTIWTPRATRRLAEAGCERELPRWLASVEREALRVEP